MHRTKEKGITKMITFNEENHEYLLDGKKLISVTQLMRKHNLAPNYDNVPQAVLNAKAERGSLIHKEIEDYIKKGEIGFTSEFSAFKEYIELNDIKVIKSEEIVHNDIVAGTLDLVLCENGNYIVADIKTTSTIHKDAISWQLSIYTYLLNKLQDGCGLNLGQTYHFDKVGALRVVEIPLKPFEEVEKLFECERNGTIYKYEVTLQNSQLARLCELEALIKHIEEEKAVAEKQANELRNALLVAMEENGISSFENDNIKLTYIAPSVRESVDSTRLKKEMPEIADKYKKTSQVKASLRITLKDKKDADNN